ncbi:hypothetical protein GYA28_02720 [Candidatus Roizmanbacteria bacterium]|jgi:hypothetical protein|nr:hypothetical protein [Candidatus Roizmanbacteria bacterium]
MLNYTPLDLEKLKKKDNGVNTMLLLMATLTAGILAVMLFVLIQKKTSQEQLPSTTYTDTSIESPTPSLTGEEMMPTASVSPVLDISPAVSSPSGQSASSTPELTK